MDVTEVISIVGLDICAIYSRTWDVILLVTYVLSNMNKSPAYEHH